MESDRKLAALRNKTHKAIIVGAGVTGIGVSHYLERNGIDFLILEKSASVGGIWSSQKWPGVRCDTEIISYSYSFLPLISTQPLVSGDTVARYLERAVAHLGIGDRILFGVTVGKAVFDDKTALWHVDTNVGRFAANFLINANGYFAEEGHSPAFERAGAFQGKIVHLSRLDDSAQIENKDVVLVGSGASAITAAPALCSKCRSLTLLQRSPSYIYEDRNRIGPLTRAAQIMYQAGLPLALTALIFLNRLKNDLVFVGFRQFPNLGRAFFRRHWRGTVDARTFDKGLQPSYNPWEQRIPIAVGLKAALKSGRIRVITGRIKRFTAAGILLEDGEHIAADICILATGYDLRLFKFDLFVGDRKIDTRRINYYKGMMLGGVPNYFQPFGVLHASWTHRIETVSRLVAKIIRHMEGNGLKIVWIDRKSVPQRPRITPNYITRSLSELPAMHGTSELPTIDNLFAFHFRKADFNFSAGPRSRAGAR